MLCAGSHTGAIEAVGGLGDPVNGGGGAGGRVAVYHSSHLSMPPFRGDYNVYGGQPSLPGGAEAGASGTIYLFDGKTDHDTLIVNNKVRLCKGLYKRVCVLGCVSFSVYLDFFACMSIGMWLCLF